MSNLPASQSEKHVLLSKTLWVNLIMAVVAVLAAKWPSVKEYVNETNVALVFTFVNMLLRIITKDKLYFS